MFDSIGLFMECLFDVLVLVGFFWFEQISVLFFLWDKIVPLNC